MNAVVEPTVTENLNTITGMLWPSGLVTDSMQVQTLTRAFMHRLIKLNSQVYLLKKTQKRLNN